MANSKTLNKTYPTKTYSTYAGSKSQAAMNHPETMAYSFHKNKLGIHHPRHKRPKSAILYENINNKNHNQVRFDPPFNRWETSYKKQFEKNKKKFERISKKVSSYH